MIDTEQLFKAKQELAKFLEDHPELRDFQAKIDETLRKAGPNHNNRMLVLKEMMLSKVNEMKDACEDVKKAATSLLSTLRHD